MEKKQFHLGDILAVTTGLPVSTRGRASIYELLFFMLGKAIAIDLPEELDKWKQELLLQNPQLAFVDTSGFNAADPKNWLSKQIMDYGEQLWITQIAGPGVKRFVVQYSDRAQLVAQEI